SRKVRRTRRELRGPTFSGYISAHAEGRVTVRTLPLPNAVKSSLKNAQGENLGIKITDDSQELPVNRRLGFALAQDTFQPNGKLGYPPPSNRLCELSWAEAF